MLRNYQQTVVDEFGQSIAEHRMIVVACPTGSGKTVIAVDGIVPLLPQPIAWVTHRRELAGQLNCAALSVFMSQAQEVPRGFASVIIDEAHHSCTDQYRRIIAANPNAFIVALTATPYRMDGQGLGSCGFTKIIYGPDIHELTEAGFLCRARVFVPENETSGAWEPDAAAALISKRKFRKGIVYCRSVEDAQKTAKALCSFGVNAGFVSGQMEDLARERIVNNFTDGDLKVICNHTILTEGNDIPQTDLVVLNRATQSRCLWRQMTGRGLRMSPGKSECVILDLAGNGMLHGSIYDREIFSLDGSVEKLEPREFQITGEPQERPEYEYNHEQNLKEWAPKPKPIRIIESLQRQKSPLLRLRSLTA